MRIVVIGAGSIGTVIGLLLKENGHQVILHRRRGKFGKIPIKMIGVHSLMTSIRVNHIYEKSEADVDLFILSTQKQQSREALEVISKNYTVTEKSIFLCLQNGLEVSDTVISIFPYVRVIQGIVWWSATLIKYDEVYYHRKAKTFLGQTYGKKIIDEIYNLLQPIIDVEIVVDIEQEVRKKLILNVVSPVLALVKKPYPEGLNNLEIRKIVHILFDEALDVANKFDWKVEDQILFDFHKLIASIELIEITESNLPVHKVSTQISAEKHGGKDSNGGELLSFFIQHGAKGCQVVLDRLQKLPSNYEGLSKESIREILEKLSTTETNCLLK